MERQLKDLFPLRRDVLKWGGAALASVFVEGVTWPLQVRAAGKATPRKTARNCIFIELAGAISHVDCFDFKETEFTPKDLDVRKVSSELYLSKTLFPRLSDQMNRIAIVRSRRSHEELHFRGQYYTQSGRPLQPAFAKEIPAFGTVIAAELDSVRRETDTFPTYVSTNLASASAGTISTGFFPARFAGMDLNASTVFDAFGGNTDGVNNLLEERWRLLNAFAKVSDAERAALGGKVSEYETFYKQGYGILRDPRWSAVFNRISKEERENYGNNVFGLGCILARNLVAADGGTRFVYIYDGQGWDHHSYIFDKSRKSNHYTMCSQLDAGLTHLLKDLSTMPGNAPGKTLLDETLIVITSEFGRTPKMNQVAGRDHYGRVFTSLFAGGGVRGGRIIGKTNEDGSQCVETGWKHKEQIWMENVVATIFSTLGIDWTKSVRNTPSKREYFYVDPLGAAEFISNDEVAELFV